MNFRIRPRSSHDMGERPTAAFENGSQGHQTSNPASLSWMMTKEWLEEKPKIDVYVGKNPPSRTSYLGCIIQQVYWRSEMLESSSSGPFALAALDAARTPFLVLSSERKVIFANKWAQKLFCNTKHEGSDQWNRISVVDVDISELPIYFHDSESLSSDTTFLESSRVEWESLTSPDKDVDLSHSGGDQIEEDFWQQHGKDTPASFEVEIQRPPGIPVQAKLYITPFKANGSRYHLLSFSSSLMAFGEPDSGLSDHVPIWHDKQSERNILRAHCRKSLSRCSSTDGTRSTSFSDQSQPQLATRFAQLRDAMYCGSELAGFLLPADETFCFPNYRGTRFTDPVPIDDVETFFSRWDVWDEHFSQKMPVCEYPILQLNRGRKNFTKRRWGTIKEDGSKHVLEGSGECLLDPYSGEHLGCVVWWRELGEYNELFVRELEGRLGSFETICDGMPHIVWTSSNANGLDYFSRSWYTFTGLTPDTSLGDGWRQTVHPDDLPGIWADFEEHKASGRPEFEAEARYRRHDGVYRWMSVRVKHFKDEKSGQVLKWYGTLTDKHKYVLMRMEASHMNKHMMNVLAHANVSLFRVNTSWELSMLEGKVLAPFNESQKGKDIRQSLHAVQDDGVPEFEARLKETMEGKVKFTTSEDLVKGRWIRTRFMQDVDCRETLKGVIGCSVDITDIHERAVLEVENARLISEEQMAKESNRLKSQFLAHMSHEIRTPIAGVIGMSDLLIDTRLNKEQSDLVDCMHISARNLLAIVNDILDFSKVEAGQMRLEYIPFNLSKLIHELCRVLGRSAQQKSLTFECITHIPGDLELLGDPGRIHQILSNLLTNAVKFTTRGTITLLVCLDETEVKMSVEDTGVGMDQETQEHLFQPFRQGDSSTARLYGGTGLGLVISQNLAQMMGGGLEISSTPKVGTTATFTMPLRRVPNPTSEDTTALAIRERRRSSVEDKGDSVILIVEDNPINQRIALTSVTKLGYRAVAVRNGQEALEYLLEDGDVSVVLMDIQMPILDGYEATRKLRTEKPYEHLRELPIIALTASAIKGDQEKCREAGMDDYLSKPYPLKILREKLATWSRKSSA